MNWQKGKFSQILLRIAIILCVSLLCFTSIGITTAKYFSKSHADDIASVACFSPSLVSDSNIDISGIKKPGDSVECNFKVQNYSDDSVSDVAMKYKIILKTTGNLPLRFTVLDSDESVIAVWSCDGTGGNREYEYECPLVFGPGASQFHDYKLKSEWLGSQNGAQFAGLTDAVYVSVKWEQVD